MTIETSFEKRHTLIVIFDEQTNKTIELLSKKSFCKIPCTIGNRQEMDTLPPHLTLSAVENDKVAKIDLAKLDFPKTFDVKSIETKQSKKGGFGIYLMSAYGHITLAVFDTPEQAQKEFDVCQKTFKPFTATVKAIQIHEIYPAKLIRENKIKEANKNENSNTFQVDDRAFEKDSAGNRGWTWHRAAKHQEKAAT